MQGLLVYHLTSKENSQLIKKNGFSSNYTFKNNKSKYNNSISFYKSIDKVIIPDTLEFIPVYLYNLKVFYYDDATFDGINSIVLFLKINSNKKNAIETKNEIIVFKSLKYKL